MSVTVYHYPACGSCRKALAWLRKRGIDVSLEHLVDSPPSREILEGLWRRSGLPLRRFFNTSGVSYRQGGFKDRLPKMSESEALEALAADGKLIKRPVIDTGAAVLVGFNEALYASEFGGSP